MLEPAISSHSLGRAWVHDIDTKLAAAGQYGLDIELFFEDLQHMAKSLGKLNDTNLIEAAHILKALCTEKHLNIICLQPFMHYEGLRDRSKHAQRIEEMKLWVELAAILDTTMIAIPSSFLPKEEICTETIVEDLQQLVDSAPHINFTYEALCWGTYINTWEQSWDIVQAVDRPNFGLCLDTFNMAGGMYADPAVSGGKSQHADFELNESLARLRSVDVSKIFHVQVVDAERLDAPLTPSHELFDPMQPSRMSWSRNCRLFYGERDRGAYLPIKRIMDTILDMGYEGPIAAELFNSCLTESAPSMPYDLAERAVTSFKKLSKDFQRPALSRMVSGHRLANMPLLSPRPEQQPPVSV